MKLTKRILTIAAVALVLFSAACFGVNAQAKAETSSTVSTVTKLEATKKITVTQAKTSITLNWAKVSGASRYRIYQKTSSGWKALDYTKNLNYTIKNLKAGTKYTFAVRTYNSIAGKYRIIETATKPSATTKITATQNNNSVTIKWNKVANVTNYRIYQKTSDGWKALGHTEKLTYTIKNLKAGTKYTFAVRSYIKITSGYVAGSHNEIETATKAIATSKVTATQTNNSITLNWSKVNGVTNYRIYQKTADGWRALGYTNKLTYTIENLKVGTKYTFAVRSYIKTTSGSVAGNYKEIETATKPVATSKITTSQTETSVTLNWIKVSNATKYRVYQKINSDWKALDYTDKLTYTIKNLTTGTNYTFAVRTYVTTKSGSIAGNYREIKVTTKSTTPVTPSVPDANVIAVTDGGIKLYKITSNEAKEIFNKWCDVFDVYYEGKTSNGTTIIFADNHGVWLGLNINGATCDEYGNIKYCPYCGKISGLGTDMCNGCNISFG